MKKNPTFAGIPEEFAHLEKSRIVLIPVPYDGTSTWGKGADRGPAAFLEAAENMELYDIETDSEVYREGIYLASPITENDSPQALVEEVHKQVKEYIKRNKFVTLIGGEHSLSIGSVRAFNECFDNLTVLQIDAHADLRKEYMGTPFNHACALHEASQTTNLIQVGIRSMDAIERTYMEEEKTFFAHEMATDEFWMDRAIDLMTENVFITFDLDGLDPSIMPSTGTPEPGGLFWYETLEFLYKVFEEKNVVGFDLVELCPNPNERSSDFLAAKLYYKMLSYKFAAAEGEPEPGADFEQEDRQQNFNRLIDEDDY
ncbi:MAG: agmatinase [Robiginitalea sp.]|nr:agmatinase [Robiginitalea sp.]